MCISDKQTISEKPTFFLGNDELCIVDKYKYLDHVVQCNLSDNGDIYCQVRSMYGRANTVCKKFNFCSDSVKIQLFKSYSANMYFCQLWCKYTVANYNKLKVSYNNNPFRILFELSRRCSASEMFVSQSVVTFEALICKCLVSLLERT